MKSAKEIRSGKRKRKKRPLMFQLVLGEDKELTRVSETTTTNRDESTL
jgi:hypothetical protein